MSAPDVPSSASAHVAQAVTPRGEFLRGFRLSLPVLPGIGVWGMVSGVAMIKAGLTIPQALFMTFAMYAGSAQLATLPLITSGVPIGIILLTAAVVNLRFLIYGIGLAPAFRRFSWPRRIALGFFNADLGFVLFVPRYQEEPNRPCPVWLYMGVVGGAWFVWQAMTLVGIFLGGRIPTDWGLEIAGSLALLALVVPLLNNVRVIVGAAVALGVALVGIDWPMRLGMITAVLAGTAAAMLMEFVAPPPAAQPASTVTPGKSS